MALSIIQHPPALIMARQPVTFVLQATSTVTPLRISGGVTQVGGDSVQADALKKATFELSDYLQGLITMRGETGNIPVVYTDVPLPVTFNFIEWVGDPPVDNFDLEEVGPYYLLDGYVPKSRRKQLYATHASLLAYLQSSKAFLTWYPVADPKNILPVQNEFLNFLQLASPTAITITLNVTLLFTDGTTSVGVVETVPNVEYMKMVYFPVGYGQLGLSIIMASSYPGKELAGYSVTVKTGSTVISQAFTFALDTAYYEHPRTLLIRNAFGLLETLVCTGLSEQENAIKPEMAETDGQVLADKLNWKTVQTDTVSVNTGFLTGDQMLWLSDMDFLEAYEVINNVLHPIVFTDLKLPVVHTGEYQYSADLEYLYAYNETTEKV